MGGRTRYGHYACAQELARAGRLQLLPPVCKHFVRQGFCLAGPNCFYQHPAQPDTGSRAPDEGIRAALEGATPKLSNAEARKANRGVGRRNRVRNNWRAAMFRKWLLDTFGSDALGSGAGVLDVGGGSGELSFELVNLNHLASTVVDPRPLNLDGSLRKLRLGMFQRSLVLGQYNVPVQLGQYNAPARLGSGAAPRGLQADAEQAEEDEAGEQDGEQQGAAPPHIQMMLTDELVQAVAALSTAQDTCTGRRPVTKSQAAAGAGGAGADAPAAQASEPASKASMTAPEASATASQVSGPATEASVSPPQAPAPGAAPSMHQLRTAALRVIGRELTRAKSVEWSSKGLRFGEHEEGVDEDAVGGKHQDISGSASQGLGPSPGSGAAGPAAAALGHGASPDAPPALPCLGLGELGASELKTSELAAGMGTLQAAAGEAGAAIEQDRVGGEAPGSRSAGDAGAPSAGSGGEPGPGDAERALALLQGCSIVVGMHPDQAAGPIVDLAVALQKPFALVPCCVYARQFPKRRLSDGRPVCSYEELVRFLVEKDPSNIKAERLPFEGKNIVLYRLPQAGVHAESLTLAL